ncbi:hypothetical protein RFI_06800, partial [Reticulomyxa filosa]
ESMYLDDSVSNASNVSSLAAERQDLSSLKYHSSKKTGPTYVEAHAYASRKRNAIFISFFFFLMKNSTAITRYQPDPSVKTLSQRLEEEKKQKEEEEKKQEQAQSLLSKVVAYIW